MENQAMELSTAVKVIVLIACLAGVFFLAAGSTIVAWMRERVGLLHRVKARAEQTVARAVEPAATPTIEKAQKAS
ncbi:MAG: hypothetical protein ACOC6A_04300 [Chloroflexota bacterium]